MKSHALLLAAALAVPSLCAADEFSDYRIPAHSWQSGDGSLFLNASRSRRTYESSDFSDAIKVARGDASGHFRFGRGRDSDRLQHEWQVNAVTGWSGTHDERRVSGFNSRTDTRTSDGRSQAPGEALDLWASMRLYPERFPLAVELSGGANGSWSQRWARTDVADIDPVPGARTYSRNSVQDHVYDYGGRLSAAVGHGIVRDVTVVMDVHVLEERLLETGALTRPLSAAARGKLAAILSVAPRLANAHERPERFEWRELERVLREDGALAPAGLDAYSQGRAREPYSVAFDRRQRGHFVGLTVGLEHAHGIRRSEMQYGRRQFLADTLYDEFFIEQSGRSSTHADRVMVGAEAEWHRPAGWRWQWDAAGRVALPARTGEHGLSAGTEVALSWRVADRWQAVASAAHRRDYLSAAGRLDARALDQWSAGYGATLRYFLEDRTSFFVRLEESQGHARQPDWASATSTTQYNRNGGLSAGVTRRFLGRVAAPGLFDTMRPIR